VTFTVLFVCTGNICRSPVAERLLRARVGPSIPIWATSAGVAALAGYPMDPPSATALRELGGDPDGHVGRRLTPGMVTDADLILTADSSHRSAVLQADPLAFRKVFTLREFARLSADLGPAGPAASAAKLRERVREVAAQRGQAASAEQDADDIADPFGAPLRVARASAMQVAEAVDQTILALGLPR